MVAERQGDRPLEGRGEDRLGPLRHLVDGDVRDDLPALHVQQRQWPRRTALLGVALGAVVEQAAERVDHRVRRRHRVVVLGDHRDTRRGQRIVALDEGDEALTAAQGHVEILAGEQHRASHQVGRDTVIADLETALAGSDQAQDLHVRRNRHRISH